MTNISAFQKFLNRQPLYLVMYGHIEALRLNQLNIQVDRAIKNFASVYNLTDDEFNFDAAKSAYYRMAADFRDSQKTSNGDQA